MSDSLTNNKRIIWIDYAKVISIFLMVICHAGLKGIPLQVIYQFHMPAFFIISGVLYKNRGVLKEFRSFLVPIIVFSIINWFVGISLDIVGDRIPISEWGQYISVYTKSCLTPLYYCNDGTQITLFTGLWFLVSLFVVKLLLNIPLIYKYA